MVLKKKKELNLVKNNQPKAIELSHDFVRAPVGSIILQPQGGGGVRPRRLKLEPGLYKKCVTWGSGGGGGGTRAQRQSHLQFSFLEIHPDLLRRGTRYPSGAGAELCRSESTGGSLGRRGQAPPPLGGSQTPPLEMPAPRREVWEG